MTDVRVPLKMLKFGHEDGEGINARVVGREDGIAALAANIYANRSDDNPSGLIENLIVKEAADGLYSVANGNRRLAALRMIYAGADPDLPIPCTIHQVNETKAFEYSLTTSITAEQLHPVDQYEAFDRLEQHGKTQEEIAKQYGMTEKQVRQALALGRLSPMIRDVWRKGDIKAEIAQAFTLALEHDTQDKLFARLDKGHALTVHNIKRELGAYATDEEITQLLDVVGAEAYRSAGGHVTEDLFGKSHIISDEALLKQMARQLLIGKCEELLGLGWGWAEVLSDLPHGARFWPVSDIKAKDRVFEGDEEERIAKMRARLAEIEDMDEYDDAIDQEQDQLAIDIDAIEQRVRARSYPEKKRKTLGCIVNIEDGKLVVLAGIKRPAEATPSDDDEEETRAVPTSAKKAGPTPAPAEPDISNALLHRLSVQLTNATATALIQDERLAISVLLAGFDSYSSSGVKVSVSGFGMRGEPGKLLGAGPEHLGKAIALAVKLKPAERLSLLAQVAAGALDFQNMSLEECHAEDGAAAICNAIEPKVLNAALRGAFDAKDYFNGVSKPLCLKAITEAMGADMARQQGKKPKSEIAAFCIENVPPTGWLPPQLRAQGYDGPPVKKGGAVVSIADGKKSAKGRAKAAAPAKRAATAKKAAKKTSKKRR